MALWRNRLGLVKSESTYGVSSAPAATDALLFTTLDVSPVALELTERDAIQAYMGNRPSIVTQRSVPVKPTVELAGSGTAGTAPRYGPLLKACGLSEGIVAGTSVTYAPVNSSFSSCTLDYYADNGSRQAITGIRGTAELSLSAGEVPTIAFDQMGLFAAPTALARPSETYTAQSSPVAVNSDNTTNVVVHSLSACMTAFSLSLGVEMVFEQKAGCVKQVRITDRKPSGSITIELPDISTKDFVAIASAQTTGSLGWVHGSTPGNIITFAASSVAFDSPTFEDVNSVTHVTLPYRLLGDNTWSIAYT